MRSGNVLTPRMVEVALKRPEHGARRCATAAQRLVVLLVGDHHPAEHVAVTRQELGHAVHGICAPSSSGRISSGVAKVLSTINAAPAARATRRAVDVAPPAAAGLEMVSDQDAPGLASATAAPTAVQVADIDKAHAQPKGSMTFMSSLTVAP